MAVISDSERDRLFRASWVALIATAMCFAIRADTLDTLRQAFSLTQVQIGWVASTAFWGFTVAILIGGQLCDSLGMGRLLAIAFGIHISGVLLTIFSVGFWSLYCGTLLIGLANGSVESVLNPLIPTIYPDSKTEKLNALHTWFPGGIVIGGLLAAAMSRVHWNWQVKTASILIPTLAYGALFLHCKLPPTERVEKHVTTSAMYCEALRPGFLVLLFCMLLTAATELGPEQWIPSLLSRTTRLPGILVLVWITGLMAIGRHFAGRLVSRMAPTTLLLFSALLSAAGLAVLGTVVRGWQVFTAATVYALGVCYLWPTMYGITSEQHPAGGALLLALIGSVGMLSDAFVVPLIGHWYDVWGPAASLRAVAVLPCAVAVVFAVMWWRDRRHGGYKIVKLPLPAARH